jgi:putative ABC transport system permease protein
VTFVVLDRFHLAISLVTVIASSIFLLALMVMLVDERRDTVAILRLIGLRRRRIFIQVLAEGLVIALAGAVFGVVLAGLLEGGFNRFFQWRYDTALVFVRVTPAIAARAVAVAVPLGILASVAASWSLLRRGAMALARR